MKRPHKTDRSIPLGVRRPDSDELFGGPFSFGRRSERYGTTSAKRVSKLGKLHLRIMKKHCMKKEN